ncbi:uncharacterized protein FYW61_003860 isoform 2-T4 [Anableps anableps]
MMSCYLLLVLFCKIACGLSLVTSSTQNLENKETLTCFMSSDPEAVNARQLHGSHSDEGLLWSRASSAAAPLPRCSSSSFSPPPSHCELCLLEVVYVICDNLPNGVELYLEGPGKPYKSSRCTCPTLPPAGEFQLLSFCSDFI